jgi:hypothetical protein
MMAAFVVALVFPASAYAQPGGDPGPIQEGSVNLRSSATLFEVTRGSEIAAVRWEAMRTPLEPGSAASRSIRQSLETLDFGEGPTASRRPGRPFQASSDGRQRSARRKVLGGLIGAAGGFFGGGYLGAAIEGDRCDCDDPGLMGAIIGAPIGAVVGAIAGFKLF